MNGLLNTVPTAALTQSQTLVELGLVVVLAAAAPLIGQILRLPSILVLLALGFGAGAVGALDPNALLGQQLISAVVSVAVGIILFEAGLDLKLSKLTGAVARVSRRLVTLGILVTWAIGTVAAYLLFDLSFEVALVLGAVLVVSGPTVVGPLLEFIRPSKTVNLVLKWEGTLADPIGATLGVVVFNAVVAGHAKAGQEIFQFLLSVGVGVGFGVAGAALILAWAAWFKPNQTQAVTGVLMFVVAMVVGADLLRDDSGLITGLVIGAILVNRPPGGTEPQGVTIERAKLVRSWRARIGTLTTFLIGMLFIILSARVTPDQIAQIGWVSIAFVAVLVFVGRPLAVALSTFGSSLDWRERAFIAWMAPRGIVAAATSSTFALGLSQAGIGGGAQDLIPITFIVIVATALIYGLSGAPVARALGVARTGPGGVLLIGASPVGRAIGRALQARGLTVVLWTANEEHARAAEADGLVLVKSDPTQDATETAPSDLDGARTNQQDPSRARARDAERASDWAAAEPVDERGGDDHDEGDRDQILCPAADTGLAQAERERRGGRGRDDPRGAIQAMNARSRQSSDEPNVDSATASGRPTNTSTATKAMLTQPICAIWCGVTRAERMMNKIPIRNVVSVPIRSRHERTSFARSIATPCGSVPPGGRLTRIAPITRPVIRPESSRSRSAPTTIATTNINAPVTACDWLGLNHAAQARIRAAPATPKPTPTPTLRRNWKISCPAFACPATTALNTTTPSVAPMGSARVPSHFRTRLTCLRRADEVEQRPDHRRAGDDEHRAEHERDLEGQVEQEVGGDRPDRPRDQDSEGHQSAGDASDGAGELAQLQAEPGFEQDDPDGNRDNGGDQLLAKQGVGIQRTGRACTEPQGEQHQDRRQPQDLADQGRRRCQDDHEPELEQRSRLGERRYRDCVEQAVHRCGAGLSTSSPCD